jgi:N-methylhydantoinase A
VDSYAGRLGCREIVIPRVASVFSAFGIASSDVKRVEMVSEPMLAPFGLDRWRLHFEALQARLVDGLEAERLPTVDLQLRWFVDLQFRGQVHTVRVPVSTDDLALGDGGEAVIERFCALYEAKFGAGTAYRKAGVEAMTFTVEAAAALPTPALDWLDADATDPADALLGSRPIHLGDGSAAEDVPVYAAERLRPGHAVDGPLLVEAEDTNVLVRRGHRLWVDGLLNMRIDLEARA